MRTADSDYDWLTVSQVARYLQVTDDTIYERVRQREIPSVKIGRLIRIPKDEFLAALRAGVVHLPETKAKQSTQMPGLRLVK